MQPHRLDPLSLTVGALFLAVGVGHLLGRPITTLLLSSLRVWPLLLVAAGVALLLRRSRSTDGT